MIPEIAKYYRYLEIRNEIPVEQWTPALFEATDQVIEQVRQEALAALTQDRIEEIEEARMTGN